MVALLPGGTAEVIGHVHTVALFAPPSNLMREALPAHLTLMRTLRRRLVQ